MLEREAQKCVATVNIELLADVCAVIVYGSRMDEEQFADFAAGFVFGD